MISISELTLNFLINAAWQITVVAGVAWVCARLLKSAAARYRNALWVASLFLSMALPVSSLYGVRPDAPGQATGRPAEVAVSANPAFDSTRPAPNLAPAPAIETAPSNSASLTQLLQRRRLPVSGHASLLLALALGYWLFILFRVSRLWRAWRRTQLLRKSVYQRELPAQITTMAARCQKALGLVRVQIVGSSMIRVPVTLGGHRPLIILPETFWRNLEEDALCSVLGHEMAHIARRDFTLNIVYEFLLLPVSFHPLARFIKRHIERTRELACDELVTERLLEPQAHARSLIQIAGSLVVPADKALMLGIFDADILEERIMKLTRKQRRLGRRAGRILALAVVTLLSISSLTISTFSFELRRERQRASQLNVTPDQVNANPKASDGRPAQAFPAQQSVTQARPAGTPQLTSGNAQERAQAACDLGKQGAVDSIPVLVSMLADDTRTEPVKCWTEGRWNPALSSFKHPSPGEQAAIALASMGTRALGPLTNALGSANSNVRRNAAWAIGELTSMVPGERADAVVPLISLLSDADNWVRMAAARALGELRDERSSDPLMGALLDGEPAVRQLAAWALGEMKEGQAVQALCAVLISDTQVEVRLAAAEALGEIRSDKAVASLTRALDDSEPRVRAKARWAIAEIQDSDG